MSEKQAKAARADVDPEVRMNELAVSLVNGNGMLAAFVGMSNQIDANIVEIKVQLKEAQRELDFLKPKEATNGEDS